jgi:hypothetical protein
MARRSLCLLWIERDRVFCRVFGELLQREAARRNVILTLRVAANVRDACRFYDGVDGVLCDIATSARGSRPGLRFLETCRPRKPVIVLSDDLTLHLCVNLRRLAQATLVKRDALRSARALAFLLIDIVGTREHAGPGPRKTSLDDDLETTYGKSGENVTVTARMLGKPRTTVQSRLKKLALR